MKNSVELKVIKIIKSIYKNKKIELHPPFLDRSDQHSLKKCIKTKEISTYGNLTKKFEKKIKNITKAKFVVALNSGTSALHMAIQASGIKKNEEVLVPSLSFIASVNAIIYNNSVPHFIELDPELGIDIRKLDNYLSRVTIKKNNKFFNKNTKKPITGIIPTHIFGHVGDMIALKKISNKYKLKIIEDASEAFGSYYKKKHAGTFGVAGGFSFNGNKIITTGAGGAVLTNSKKIADRVRFISTVSKKFVKNFTIYDEVGYNNKMPSINAALGISQLEKFKYIKSNKKLIHFKYKKLFQKYFNDLEFVTCSKYSSSNYWLNAIKSKRLKIDNIIALADKENIQLRRMWSLVSKGKYYKQYPSMELSNSIKLSKSLLCIPSGVN